ncbi:MAG: hypothetical protein JXN59_01890, partial [Anaerolineae bacterium]|nr:hypothetical protein [Anaerolineae bacterium]
MPPNHPMTDNEFAEHLARLQTALNTALDVARHVHIEKSSPDDADVGYIRHEYHRLLNAVNAALEDDTAAALDYRVDYPPPDEFTPVGFSVCVRIKLEVVPEPITDEEQVDIPPRL